MYNLKPPLVLPNRALSEAALASLAQPYIESCWDSRADGTVEVDIGLKGLLQFINQWDPDRPSVVEGFDCYELWRLIERELPKGFCIYSAFNRDRGATAVLYFA